MKELLKLVLFISLTGCLMTQPNPIDDQGNDKVPVVSILPVGNPIPLPNTQVVAGELAQSNTALEHEKLTSKDSKEGDSK